MQAAVGLSHRMNSWIMLPGTDWTFSDSGKIEHVQQTAAPRQTLGAVPHQRKALRSGAEILQYKCKLVQFNLILFLSTDYFPLARKS